MTTRELYFKYKDIFILALEAAGEQMGNSVYKNVEVIINDHELAFLRLIDEGAPFNLLITDMICSIVIEVHGADNLENQELSGYIGPLFDLYLKKPTRAFCTQNGVPVIKDLSQWFAILKKRPKSV